MGNLRQIRGSVWVAYLLKQGGFKSLAAMHNSLNVVGSVQSWTSYKSGKETPLLTTIKVVDKVIPGSADMWHLGPYGGPLWSVLAGDLAVCLEVVNRLLMNFRNAENWMLVERREKSALTEYERVKALFEIVLPRSLWEVQGSSTRRDLKDPKRIEMVGWLSLPQLFSQEKNALYENYNNNLTATSMRVSIKQFVDEVFVPDARKRFGIEPSDYVEQEANLFNRDYLLGFIALIHICKASADSELIGAADFIKNGIYQPLIDRFDQRIAQFVLDI